MKQNFEKNLTDIEQLGEYTVQVDVMIKDLEAVGAKEEFYPLQESATDLHQKIDALKTPEKDELINRLTNAVIAADIRTSDGREEIEGGMAEAA